MFNTKRINYIDIIALIICLAFIAAGILVSLNRFWQYEVFYYDFGIFDQAIWKVSRFQAPIIDHFVVGGNWIFADHFSPSIFLLSPLFWITEKSETLLVAQSIIVGLSAVVLYSIGKDLLKSKFQSFSILICYIFFVGLQNAVISDFHEVTVMALPFMLTVWAFVKRKILFYIISLLVTLGFKESTFLLGATLGVAIFFLRTSWWRISLLTIGISLLWGFLSIKIIIPYFSGGIYQYGVDFPKDIGDIVSAFIDYPLKIRTLFYSFFSFGFLPFLTPQFWIVIFQDFFVRFFPKVITRWDMGLHYSAQLSPILGVSSIYAFLLLKKRISERFITILSGILIINAMILYAFILHDPFALSYNPDFYKHTKDFKFLDDLVNKIPKEASVMTQNNLAVRFTHQDVFLLRNDYQGYDPDYVLIDSREGQNPNNFFGEKNLDKIVDRLQNDSNYEQKFATKEQFIFRKKE